METELDLYIKENWKNTVRVKKSEYGIELPYPFSVPCIDERYICFFYWDSYFINVGLLMDDLEQARNNIENMNFLVDRMGFIPNGNHQLMFNRSQPPLYSHAVMDYYRKTNDISIISSNYVSMKKEYEFWMKNRVTDLGLNQYCPNPSKDDLDEFFSQLEERGFILSKGDYDRVKHYFSEAESGWDFSPRFNGKANDYVQVDLNSILYRTEQFLQECAHILGYEKDAIEFQKAHIKRKELLIKYLMDEFGVFHDYDFINKKLVSFVSVASMLPFAMGLSTDKSACLKTLEKLEFEFGVSATEKIDVKNRFQWAYPNMWAPLVFWTYNALIGLGLTEDAYRISEKYSKTLENNFAKTGTIWEKYNVNSCEVSHSEYQSPPMMGWTAGVYRFFKEMEKV